MKELTGNLRWIIRDGLMILQQQWGRRNNWAWSSLEWIDVPTVDSNNEQEEGNG